MSLLTRTDTKSLRNKYLCLPECPVSKGWGLAGKVNFLSSTRILFMSGTGVNCRTVMESENQEKENVKLFVLVYQSIIDGSQKNVSIRKEIVH